MIPPQQAKAVVCEAPIDIDEEIAYTIAPIPRNANPSLIPHIRPGIVIVDIK
jgi:hypothetical protein